MLITRSREGNDELATKLKTAGLNPIPFDTISLAPPGDWSEVDRVLGRLGKFDWVVFTSPTGAKYFESRMKALSLQLPWKGPPRVAAVGQRTALALSGLGVKPDFVPSSYTTGTLGDELPGVHNARILLLRSDIANRSLIDTLVHRGFRVEEVAIYRTVTAMEPGRRIEGADVIVFASPSAVKGFCSLVTEEELRTLKRLRTICIGPVTRSAAKASGFLNTAEPESFTLDAVVREIARLNQPDA